MTTFTCVLCSNDLDVSTHLFRHCKLASEIRVLLCNWTKKDIPNEDVDGVLEWCDNLNHHRKIKDRLEAIMFVGWWYI